MTTIRIDVILSGDFEEAYRTLCERMDRTGLAWESTDEWFRDGGVVPINPSEVRAARDAIVEERNLSVRIFRDDDSWNPRTDWDCAGTMYCTHRRYDLGDKKAVPPEECDEEIVCKLPLYLYDHGGITMSVGSFNDQWDSGQVGWIYLTKSKAEEFGIEPKGYEDCLKAEVKIYDHYLQGNVWGFTLGDPWEGGDSCGGFYGSTLEETGMLEHVPERFHENMKKAWDNR